MREQMQQLIHDPDTPRLIGSAGIFTFSLLADMAVLAQQIGMIAGAITAVWILIDKVRSKSSRRKR